MPYRIIEKPWPSDRSLLNISGEDELGKALVATERYSAAEFRDSKGAVIHQYKFPQGDYFFLLRHYLSYLTGTYEHLNPDSMKTHFLRDCMICLRKLAAHRKTASILEIGGTIGENYWMLSDIINNQNLDIKLEFVGIELDGNAVQFSREIFHGNDAFEMIHGDASDLSRFPDNSFDLVISHSTNNFLQDPHLGLREALRVSRFGTLLHLFMNLNGESKRYTHGSTGQPTYIFSREELQKILFNLGSWKVYNLTRFIHFDATILPTGGDGFFIEDISADQIYLEHLVISRFAIFPELAFLEDSLESSRL